jgi:DNA-binding SARP family transcriptional activator/tetratricopeptide (TPR) repeat protein
MISVNMLRLLTFGSLALVRRDGSSSARPRPQRLAILAVLAASGNGGISRERVSALLWPDADPERARHSLRQALYALRQEIGADAIRPEAILSLDGDVLTSDVGDFREAIATQQHERAAALFVGPFLHGFQLAASPEFDRWVDAERTILATDAARVLLLLAKAADAAPDRDAAAESWRRLTLIDPLSGRFALGYLKALAARGDRAAALAFSRAHEDLVRRELETDPDPDIRRLEAVLRAMPTPSVVRAAPVRSDGAPQDGVTTPAPNEEPASPVIHGGDTVTAARTRRRRGVVGVVTVAVLVLGGGVLSAKRLSAALGLTTTPSTTLAVGMIREEGVPDSLRIGGVLTDMLATNLARVAELSVLANSRLFELMVPGQDTLVAGYSAAARGAGATEILQGRLLPGPDWSLALEMQRVDLQTGMVKGGYRVAARDRYALIDSMTAAIARDMRLQTPGGSVSDATTDSPVAYRLYEEGLRAFHQYDAAAAKRLMEAALLEDSTFAMAAYYVAKLSYGDAKGTLAGMRALRLAARAPEHLRLTITAHVSLDLNDPLASVYAESLVTKFPNDPRALEHFSRAQATRGDWVGAAAAIERSIVIDSASEPVERQDCRLCGDLIHLAGLYHALDSFPAADRTARRLLRLRPQAHSAWDILLRLAAARGDSAAFHSFFRRFHEANPLSTSPHYRPRYLTLLEAYDEAERELRPLLDSPRPWEGIDSRWIRTIGLRNQGRLAEVLQLARVQPGPNDIAEAMIALERGTPAGAIEIFARRARADQSIWAPGVQARQHAWTNTLLGMALLAAGDTMAVRRLADTVETWGKRSNFGRDRQLHHYLRGMLFVAQRRDAEAAPELERAIFTPTHGFTRVNYELGRVLLRLNRPAEVVPVVRAALHGDLDGANLYVTRTDLHELLAQAFDRLGLRDSARVHYRAVVRAWERADPVYDARRDSARTRLSAMEH